MGNGQVDNGIAIGAWVRVYPGTDRERLGEVIEDLLFVDSGDLSPC